MATIKDTAATAALNEQDYINKLYDSNDKAQKQILGDNFTANNATLDTEQQNIQRETQEYINRTNAEAAQAQNLYTGAAAPKVSSGAAAQMALTQDNQQQKNTTTLKNQQSEADAEIERQRQLLGSLYETEIKKAQADNDLERAQALYEAAKTEDAQFLALRKQAASLLAEKGDNSIYESLASGGTTAPTSTGATWDSVLKNEAAINQIYDSAIESATQENIMERDAALSELMAQQRKQQAATDESLNQAYIDGLRKMKNYAEVQTAYGQGSGAAAQARLAQQMGVQGDMTGLRKLQLGADAQTGMSRFDIFKAYRDAQAKTLDEQNRARAKALYDAAEAEEQTQIDLQQTLGNQYAKNNDYSVLGLLWGLSQDQIDRLQGTGSYAPSYHEEETRTTRKFNTAPSSSGGGGSSGIKEEKPQSSGSSGSTSREGAAQRAAVAAERNEAALRANTVAYNKQKAREKRG